MREIKFRFYDKNDTTDKISVSERTLADLESEDSWQGSTPWKRIATCEYTGLVDKNGTEIYEGDIVQIWRKEPLYYTIIYSDDEGAFKRKTVLHPHGSYAMEKNPGFVEVIGNIYSNPEMLK